MREEKSSRVREKEIGGRGEMMEKRFRREVTRGEQRGEVNIVGKGEKKLFFPHFLPSCLLTTAYWIHQDFLQTLNS